MTVFADRRNTNTQAASSSLTHRQTWTTKEQELKQLMDRAEQGAGGALVNVLAYKADYVAATEELKLLERAAKTLLFARKLEQQLRDTLKWGFGQDRYQVYPSYRVRVCRGERILCARQ